MTNEVMRSAVNQKRLGMGRLKVPEIKNNRMWHDLDSGWSNICRAARRSDRDNNNLRCLNNNAPAYRLRVGCLNKAPLTAPLTAPIWTNLAAKRAKSAQL